MSESVMHKARCPVLVVRDPKRAALAATSDEHRVAEPLKTRDRIAA